MAHLTLSCLPGSEVWPPRPPTALPLLAQSPPPTSSPWVLLTSSPPSCPSVSSPPSSLTPCSVLTFFLFSGGQRDSWSAAVGEASSTAKSVQASCVPTQIRGSLSPCGTWSKFRDPGKQDLVSNERSSYGILAEFQLRTKKGKGKDREP